MLVFGYKMILDSSYELIQIPSDNNDIPDDPGCYRELPYMPFFSANPGGAMLKNDRMFVFCGGRNYFVTSLTSCYIFTPHGGTWLPLKLQEPRANIRAIAIGEENETLFVIGGYLKTPS